MTRPLIFEQPLHERIRLLLRLEALTQRFGDALQAGQPYDHHEALVSLVDIYALVTRVDIKRELMGEIERQTANLQRLADQPGIDASRFRSTMDDQRRLHTALEEQAGALDGAVRENEFFNSVRQRMALPGGAFDFDLPIYHHWLSQPVEARTELLLEWFRPLESVTEATQHVLRYIRGSGNDRSVTAEEGFLEQPLDSQHAWQMIRVSVDPQLGIYPEISGGRQRFTVRFMDPGDFRSRPNPVREDVTFGLCCCAL
ncbi:MULTISPECIES: cell division protein ZapD [unclassified Thioalkalivibrio]|uniref:cell division protein ZapD n=1 Tax=unclassified Thioalkalivibrio TaxID=2621013 RepID=UPI0003651F07|nr:MULTISPECIES: cell division protein ZapD [unclassified Thioalkalivibrio]